jgi:hypothetical protein
MRFLGHAALSAALALGATAASAQTVPLEMEGKIVSVISDGNGGAVMKVMGVDVAIPATASIASPTASLTMAQLLDSQSFPGRAEPGFLGGTAIITGTTGPDGNVADDVFVEPAENVILGRTTGSMQINGMGVQLLADLRVPALPVVNAFGFEIDPATIPVGTSTSAEGYFADSSFHAFLIESEGGSPVNAGVQEVAIQRAQCRQRTNGTIELEVRGSTHDPAAGAVTLRNTAGTITYGTPAAVADAAVPQFGAFVFRVSSNRLGPCPSQIRATFGTASSVGTVAVRVD